MKKSVFVFAILGLFFAGIIPAKAANVGVNVNFNLGLLPEPPVFIAPPSLGFFVAVGIPYDMFLFGSNYYMYRNDAWYISRGYNGPWGVIEYRRLPRGLRKHKYEQIISIRDQEYRVYEQDRDHYRGKHYRPENREVRHENNKDTRGETRIQENNRGGNNNKKNNRGEGRNKGHGKN
jgi:hypothetical protein